jgi:hypothetical protein
MQSLLESAVGSFSGGSAAFDVIVPFGSPGYFIQQFGIIFGAGMGNVSADLFQITTGLDIISLVKIKY